MDKSSIEHLTPEQADNVLAAFGRLERKLGELIEVEKKTGEDLNKVIEMQREHDRMLKVLWAKSGEESKEFKGKELKMDQPKEKQ